MDRATKGNGTATDLTFTARLISGMKYIITGQLSNQSKDSPASDTETTVDKTPFSAGQPPQPVFQEGMRGRQFDYRTGYNLTYTPRTEEPVTFSQLRSLADTYDLVRLAIETRKDQMCKLSFTIKSTNEKIKDDTRIQGIMEFLRYPDKEHNWQTWIRMLFEDLLVIDAPTIYPRPTKGGDLYALELIDGALIKRALDGTGRTPVAPDVAYQQIIKGVPAVDYCRPDMSQTGKIRHDLGDGNTIDELIYIPRNVRTHKVYGFSPVEQIITIVNIALRRQLHQLEYYTEGSIPDLLLSVPETWNPDQIRQFQEFWDSLLAGNTAERRHAKFIPHGITPYDVKQNAIKDEYDEWLARVVCFAFSLPPTAFVRQMNRASAETQKEQALEEGLMPIMEWVKSVMDLIIWKYFNSPDLEFVWQDVKEVDPLVQAQIDQIYLQEYVFSQDEVRARMGIEGTAPEKPLPHTMGQDVLVADNEEEEKANNTVKNPDNATVNNKVKKVERAIKKKVLPINRQRKSIAKLRSKMTAICKDFFDIAADDIAAQVQKGIAKLKRADSSSTEAEVEDILKQIDFASWSVLVVPIAEVIEQIHQDGASTALTQIGFHTDSNSMLNLLNKKAVEYAEQRAAEMVGMKNIGTKMYPEWVANQDASFAITDSTREMLKELVTKSINEGWSTQQLESEIANSTGFSSERAEMIARTETAYADVQGNMTAYKESGVVTGKEWIIGSEHNDDDDCDANAEAGVIGIDEVFPSGDDAPPAHPNCCCDVIPVVIDKEGEE